MRMYARAYMLIHMPVIFIACMESVKQHTTDSDFVLFALIAWILFHSCVFVSGVQCEDQT